MFDMDHHLPCMWKSKRKQNKVDKNKDKKIHLPTQIQKKKIHLVALRISQKNSQAKAFLCLVMVLQIVVNPEFLQLSRGKEALQGQILSLHMGRRRRRRRIDLEEPR